MIIENNFNEIYIKLIKDVLENGNESAPRGMKIKEMLGYQFKLTDPKNCLCTIKERKLNYKFAIIEKWEYIIGMSDPGRICFYNKNFSYFINPEKKIFDGAYGPRLGRQYYYIYHLLRKDPDSRQAVININNESDKHESKDIPCTVSLQFLIRDGKLNLITTMRSNDVLWGVPYDVNGFCFIQQMMASWLGVKLGEYIHQAGSMHIYEERKEQLEILLGDISYNEEQNPSYVGKLENEWDIKTAFSQLEYEIRNKQVFNEELFKSQPDFLKYYIKRLCQPT